MLEDIHTHKQNTVLKDHEYTQQLLKLENVFDHSGLSKIFSFSQSYKCPLDEMGGIIMW